MWKFFLIFAIFPLLTAAQNRSISSICVSQEKCHKCLAADVKCSWCTDRAYDMRKPRCMTKEDLLASSCREEFIEVNVPQPVLTIRNDPLQDFAQENLHSVQIQPQRIKMKLRKGYTETVKMTYRPARNYPLDVYYLMDLTWSMGDDKATLVNMGGSLSNALRTFTENYRLGFGSFADKPTMPYAPITEAEKENPCASNWEVCEPTYGFRHRLSLSQNVSEFIERVNSSAITANLDNMEGGLDALMQVLVCQDEIGWSQRSRKMVVLASDGLMHVAGFGLLGGVVAKNDKKCHLSPEGEYLASLEYDYPSIEEIYRELTRSKINVIFAVNADKIEHYDAIHGLLSEQTSVGKLEMDSSNILQLVEDGYKEFSRKLHFVDDSPDTIRLEYFTTCGGKFKDLVKTDRCDNAEIGEEIDFYVNVTLLENPEDDGIYNHLIRIEESSLSHEYLELDITLDFGCPCIRSEQGEKVSRICDNHGELICGMCLCDEGFVGKTCNCNLKNAANSRELENQCRMPLDYGEGYSAICYDRGECFCGECYCNSDFDGKYCECHKCEVRNGVECGGVTHGFCDCGSCSCHSGWTGDFCDCLDTNSTCIAPNSEEVCSGKGLCECGSCQCESGSFGLFCEISAGAGNTLCQFYEPCVHAVANRRMGKDSENFKTACRDGNDVEYKTSFFAELPESETTCLARVKYSDDEVCDFFFTYLIDEERTTHLSITDTQCPAPSYAMAIFWSVLIATFLAGLLALIVWRVNATLSDRREYARFEEEQKRTQYMVEMSPIYRSPITKYEVPPSPTEIE